MENNQNPQDGNLNINLNEMVAAGVYCNLALVNHSPSEFVLDFIQLIIISSCLFLYIPTSSPESL